MSKFDIHVGSKIYEWTILDVDGVMCKCECSCGIIKYVNKNNLANGLSKSCGHTKRNDLTDKQFGDWRVIKYAGRRNRSSIYLCQCSCGIQKEIRSYDLTHGITKSCGHKILEQRIDLIGKHFGEWKILKFIDATTVLCRCSCGVEKEVNLYSIKSGASKSCGHNNKNILSIGDTIDDLTLLSKTANGKWRCICKCGAKLDVSAYELNKFSHRCNGKHKMQVREIAGQTFGEWTVIENVSGSLWRCKCSCGKIDCKTYYELISGKTTHCMSKVHTDAKLIDLKGKQFGKLAVVEYNRPYWVCKCSCGKTINVLSCNLRNGSTTSCGCSAFLFSKEDILKAINTFNEKPFIYELANLLNVGEATIKNYIQRYDLYDFINRTYRSRYENDIVNYLTNRGITNIITSDRKIIAPQELDIYIPEKKLAIEFNGNYWHSEETKDKYYHQQKTIACAKKGIHLIHIFEYEWKAKYDNIIDIIDSTLKICTAKIYARNTIIKEVETEDAKTFLNTHHLQGYAPASINIGCYYNNELIGLMTFGKPRFNTNYQYELIRYCWKSHTTVIGGMEKMFKYFLNNYNVQSIITYCDISKFTGNTYIKLGFNPLEQAITQPGYVWYDHINNNILTRYKTQKAHLLELGLGIYGDTEDEIMHNLGYYKIYNSGNITMEWRKER